MMSSISHEVQRSCNGKVKGIHHNLFMSLPTSLIHCILSDWVEVIAMVRLDLAFGGDKIYHTLLLDIFQSDHFNVKEVNPIKGMNVWGKSQPEHPYTHVISWLIRRQIKVASIKLNQGCWYVVLETYLQRFGKHVRQICPHEDGNQRNRDRDAPTQSALIAKYCQNLRAYFVRCNNEFDGDIGSVLGVLTNNPLLEVLHIDGVLANENNPTKAPVLTLPHLKRLKWESRDGFDESLVSLVKAAPNLQHLVLLSWLMNYTELDEALMLEVARACPHLRTLSCKELYLGRNDSFLKQFLHTCSDIGNLDLHGHQKLCDTVLIEALSELPKLRSLNLRGCCRLTDQTLRFITERFASTLEVLYLDHSEGVDFELNEERGGYTAAGIASLRTRCTQLHTFHYIIEAGTVSQPQHVAAYQMATIVQVCAQSEDLLPIILKHCKQMQILAMPNPQYGSSNRRVWLTVNQLMAIAARCPHFRMIVNEKNKYFKDKGEVDYSAVREAFPRLKFVEDASVLGFDGMNMHC